jgi:ABC-type transporter Mla MlaB component
VTTKATTAKPRARRAAEKKPLVQRILLPANMEMNGLEECFSLLRANYPPGYEKCILDGVNINVIDTSGIQLLISFVSSVRNRGCQVEWENYSLQAYQLANEMGLVEQLGD